MGGGGLGERCAAHDGTLAVLCLRAPAARELALAQPARRLLLQVGDLALLLRLLRTDRQMD